MNLSRISRTTGLAMLLLALCVAIWSFIFWTYSQNSTEPPHLLDVAWGLSFLAFPAVGWLIAVKLPHNALGWIYLIFPMVVATGLLFEELALAMVRSGNASAAALPMLIGTSAFGLGLTIMIGPGVLLFPDGRVPSRRWHWVLWGFLSLYAASLLITAFATPGVCIEWSSTSANECILFLENPLSSPSAEALGTILGPVVNTLLGLLALASPLALFVRYRRSKGDVRQQIKWVAFMGAVVIAPFLLVSIARPLLAITAFPRLDQIFLTAIQAGLPVAIALAIFKYRLYDIDRIISRTTSYAVLVGILAAVFAAMVALAQRLLPIESQFGIVGSTLVVAALFNPLRLRVQRAVERRFNRSPYDPQQVVDEFSSRLRDEVDLEHIQGSLLRAVDETLQPSSLSIWIRDDLPESQ